MSAKQVVLHEEARSALQHGADVLARTVRMTLGPKGRNVAIDRKWGVPMVTPDGVTVAKEISLPDPVEDVGAHLLKEAASKTNDVAGDGTTTSTVLAQALLDGGLGLVAAGVNPMILKRGLDKAVPVLDAAIARQAKQLTSREEIAQVAAISALDQEIGELLATIIDRVGRDAVITVEEGQGTTLEHELVEGMAFDRGYVSPYFVTDAATMEAVLDNPAILIADGKITSVAQMVPILEALTQSGISEFAIIADDVSGDALATLIVNQLRGTIKVLAVKAPGFGDRRKALLQDIAVLTGGTVISEELGRKVEQVTIGDLGHARRMRATKDETVIVEGRGDHATIAARIAEIKAQVAKTTSDYDREKLAERAASLTGGVAVIKVGAPTEPAMKERKARADDALHATRAALDEGIVVGGGVAYLNLVAVLDSVATEGEEEHMALNLLRRALEEPTRQIAANAGYEGAVVVAEIQRRQQETGNQNIGFDALREEYGDLVSFGIIDPAKVVRSALENAISVAGMLLSTDVVITDVPEEEMANEEAMT
jgi:chaperonin GroEL